MDVDYFALTALPVESEALFEHLPEPRSLASTGYWIADIKTEQGEIRSVLMYRPGCGQGTNAANTRTSYTIGEYHPRVVLLIGIAGGFDEHKICLGDVLVPEFIDPYELAKVMPKETRRRHPPETVTAGPVIEIAKALCATEWYKGIKKPRPSNHERAFPEIQARDRGVVGSGDKNLADLKAPEREYLKKRHEDRALGFEMEAAGVVSACKPRGTPYAVIKAVQDNGTFDTDNTPIENEWRSYAADAVATLAVLVMQKCSFENINWSTGRRRHRARPPITKKASEPRPGVRVPLGTRMLINLDEHFHTVGGVRSLEPVVDQLVEDLRKGRLINVDFNVEGYQQLKAQVAALEDSLPVTGPSQELYQLRTKLRATYFAWDQPVNQILGEVVDRVIRRLYLDSKHRFLSDVHQIAICLNSCFPMYSSKRVSPSGTSFDVFHPDRGWSCRILLTDDDVARIVQKECVDSVHRLTGHWGLDIFDFTTQIHLERMLPAMVFEYLRLKYSDQQPPDEQEYFNVWKWRVGIA